MVDDELQGLVLASTFTPGKDFVEVRAFLDALAAGGLPVDEGPQVGVEVAFIEDVVGDVSEPVKLDGGRQSVQLDALGDGACTGVVDLDVGEPQSGGDVLCKQVASTTRLEEGKKILTNDKLQRIVLGLANALLQQLLDEEARFNLLPVLLLPPASRTMTGLNESLAEHYDRRGVYASVSEFKQSNGHDTHHAPKHPRGRGVGGFGIQGRRVGW